MKRSLVVGSVLFEECWRVVNSAEVGGGVVVVLWHDVGRLCRFLFCRCYRELCGGGLRARYPPGVVVAVFVASGFCALCLPYPSLVGRRACSCCRSELRIKKKKSVCSCSGCYTHIYPYLAMWSYRKVTYYIVLVFYI